MQDLKINAGIGFANTGSAYHKIKAIKKIIDFFHLKNSFLLISFSFMSNEFSF